MKTNEILEIVKKAGCEYDFVGIRTHMGDFPFPPAGSAFDHKSHVFESRDMWSVPTKEELAEMEELDGASAWLLAAVDYVEEEGDWLPVLKDDAAQYIEFSNPVNYDHAAIIACNECEDGVDPNEVVMIDPVVIAVLF